MKWPIHYIYLLVGLGISQLGNWVYLIALNVVVWQTTHSFAAVATLYVIGPTMRILCSFFVGSYVDRLNKKSIVVIADIIRGVLICVMPFAQDVFIMYALVALTSIAGAFFSPSSTYLVAVHVHEEHRLRFNSLHATLNSGAFIIGPALAGVIIAMYHVDAAMWLNGITFFICAALLSRLPHDAQEKENCSARLTVQTIKADWRLTIAYSQQRPSFTLFLIVYSVALMLAFSLDSQEMTFLLTHLHVSESIYGVTVTIAGAGAVIGGLLAAACANTWSTAVYIKGGFLLTMLSYFTFYAANTYIVAVTAFVTLGLFMAFSNSGFATLYQQTVAPHLIGRFSSMLSLVQNVLQVTLTLLLGVAVELFSLQVGALCFAGLAVLLAIIILYLRITEAP